MPLTRFRLDVPALADSHMRGPNTQVLLGSVGAQFDATAEQVMQARLAANPFAGGANPTREGAARLADGRLIECEPIVLPVHAAMRGIRLYNTESPLSKRIRLSQHLWLKKMRGTPWGEIEHVRPYFSECPAYPTIAIVFQDDDAPPGAMWYQVDPAGARTLKYIAPSNFNYDDQPMLCSRWWAFVDMTGTGYAAPNVYDSGGQYDTSGWIYDAPSLQAQQDIASMFLDWSAAHSWLTGVALWWPMTGGAPFPSATGTPTQDATGWWPLPHGAGTWGSLVGPDGRSTRPPNLVWIYESDPVIV